jgi:hypothetical protein
MKATLHSLPPLDPRQRYSINEASALLRQCRAKTYRDIAAGKIESFKDGSRRYIPGRAIIERSAPTNSTEAAEAA